MNKKGFSLIEFSLTLLVVSIILGMILMVPRILKQARISNAIKSTATASFLTHDNLVFWIETSISSKEKKENDKIDSLLDLSKNKIIFFSPEEEHYKPFYKESKIYKGIKTIYFDGKSYLKSATPLNLSKYTAFVVVNPENTDSTIYNTGFQLKTTELSNNKIVVIKNDGNSKYMKKVNDKSFNIIANNDDLSSSPENFYLGKNIIDNYFKGELIEVIIFNSILNNNDLSKVEYYLNNKYNR